MIQGGEGSPKPAITHAVLSVCYCLWRRRLTQTGDQTCSVVHVLLSLEAWKIQEWGNCGFFLYGFKSHWGQAMCDRARVPARQWGHCIELWRWSLGCSGDARAVRHLPKMLRVGWSQPERKMCAPGSRSGGAKPPRPFKTKVQIPDMKLQDLVFASGF